jgi:integrase
MSKPPVKKRAKKLIAELPSGVSVIGTQSGRGRRYFRVRLGKKFTGGSVSKRDFPNLSEARDWIFGSKSGVSPHKANPGAILDLKDKAGTSAFLLSPVQLDEAAAAIRRCGEAGLSLTEAVEFAVRHAKPHAGTIDVAKAMELAANEKTKGGKAPSYVADLKKRWKRFKNWLPAAKAKAINSIGAHDVRKFLTDCSLRPAGERNMLRNLSVLFTWAVKHHYAASNPCEGIRVENKTPKAPVRILSLEEARKILKFSSEGFEVDGSWKDPMLAKLSRVEAMEMVPFVAVGAFAGLRPEESMGLDWKMIDLSARHIDIPASLAKDRNRRIVEISDNLLQWLQGCQKKSGSIIPQNFRRKRRALCRKMGWDEWPKDVLRHSFGSYHLAMHSNAPQTAELMGHRDVKMLYRHYREVIKDKASIKAFWEIVPEVRRGKRGQQKAP